MNSYWCWSQRLLFYQFFYQVTPTEVVDAGQRRKLCGSPTTHGKEAKKKSEDLKPIKWNRDMRRVLKWEFQLQQKLNSRKLFFFSFAMRSNRKWQVASLPVSVKFHWCLPKCDAIWQIAPIWSMLRSVFLCRLRFRAPPCVLMPIAIPGCWMRSDRYCRSHLSQTDSFVQVPDFWTR